MNTIRAIDASDILGAAEGTSATARKIKDARDVKEAAKGFESVLLNKLLDEMGKTIPESGLLEDGTHDQVQGIFWYYLAQDVADKGGLGLSKMLTRQIKEAAADLAPEPEIPE
jgi:Rod binding domain-containing protein